MRLTMVLQNSALTRQFHIYPLCEGFHENLCTQIDVRLVMQMLRTNRLSIVANIGLEINAFVSLQVECQAQGDVSRQCRRKSAA